MDAVIRSCVVETKGGSVAPTLSAPSYLDEGVTDFAVIDVASTRGAFSPHACFRGVRRLPSIAAQATSSGGHMTGAFVVDPSLCRRILVEYRELPGLRLSVRQAARLWSVETEDCRATLDFLVEGGWLVRSPGNEHCACQYAAGSKRLVAQLTRGFAA